MEFNFVLNVWIKPAFDSLLIIFAYVAVNVDSTTGAGTTKCILPCQWRGRIAETNVCEADAGRERTIANGVHIVHDDGLQLVEITERIVANGAHIAHGDGLQAGAATECTMPDGAHIAHFYIFQNAASIEYRVINLLQACAAAQVDFGQVSAVRKCLFANDGQACAAAQVD